MLGFSEEAKQIINNHFEDLKKEGFNPPKDDQIEYEIMEADEHYIRDILESIRPRQSVRQFLKDRGAYIGETAAGDYIFYTNDF